MNDKFIERILEIDMKISRWIDQFDNIDGVDVEGPVADMELLFLALDMLGVPKESEGFCRDWLMHEYNPSDEDFTPKEYVEHVRSEMEELNVQNK